MTPPLALPPAAPVLALPSKALPLLDSPLVGEGDATAAARRPRAGRVLVLGVGNVLMGDEGVGVHVLRRLEQRPLAPGIRLLDGGTGGVNLLAEFEDLAAVILVDATRDGRPAGTIAYLRPSRVGDLPRGLGAHDFGLKDLFAAAALLGRLPELHLFTIGVEEIRPMCTELSAPVAAAVPAVVAAVAVQAEAIAAVYQETGDISAIPPTAAPSWPTDAQPDGR